MITRAATDLTAELRDAIRDAEFTDEHNEEDGTLNLFSNNWAEITPGVRDQESIRYYLRGNCALLAVEIHRAAGWPLIMLSSEASKNSPHHYNDTRMVHVMTRRPDGYLVDIGGAITDQQALGDWQGTYPDVQVEEISEADLLSLIGAGDGLSMYSRLERAVTRDFAARLIDGRLTR